MLNPFCLFFRNHIFPEMPTTPKFLQRGNYITCLLINYELFFEVKINTDQACPEHHPSLWNIACEVERRVLMSPNTIFSVILRISRLWNTEFRFVRHNQSFMKVRRLLLDPGTKVQTLGEVRHRIHVLSAFDPMRNQFCILASSRISGMLEICKMISY